MKLSQSVRKYVFQSVPAFSHVLPYLYYIVITTPLSAYPSDKIIISILIITDEIPPIPTKLLTNIKMLRVC